MHRVKVRSSMNPKKITNPRKLTDEELARAYREHAKEWQNNPDRVFWDSAAIDDGLDDEVWLEYSNLNHHKPKRSQT